LKPLKPKIDFSTIDTELKSYLIGLFYADAYLSDYDLQLRLSIKDIYYVYKLADIIGVKTQIKNVGNTQYQYVGFSICSKKMIDELRKIGFVKRKSYQRNDIVFKNIPEELKRHFIRGYLDGDGTISISKYKKKNVNWKENIKYRVGFISINKELLESIKNYLALSLDLSDKNLRSENSGRFIEEFSDVDPYGEEQWDKNEIKYVRLIYSGNIICKKILDFLYGGSTVYMDRKFNRYKEIKIFEPKFYNYDKKHKCWRARYKDENNIKYKYFKNEIDVKNFIQEIKDPNYKIKKKEKQSYYKNDNIKK